MIKPTKFALLLSLLILTLLYSCKQEAISKTKAISENVPVKNDSVKKRINLDSLDKANSDEMTTEEEYWNKIEIRSRDSLLFLNSQMRLDHRVFGYKKPNTKSERLIFLSVFTTDVEGNPFRCKYGSHYSTTLGDGRELKYVSTENNFVKTVLLDHKNVIDTLYFEKKWIEFEQEN